MKLWSVRLDQASVRLHCESKKQDTKLLPTTSPNINRFSVFWLTDSVVNLQQTLI